MTHAALKWDFQEIAARDLDETNRTGHSWVPPTLTALVTAVRGTTLARPYPFTSHSRLCLSDGPRFWVPVQRGEQVTFRPPPWAEHGRDGSIDVPAGCPLLIIEGVGAGRREAAHLVDALVCTPGLPC
jgi:hypothetical protein